MIDARHVPPVPASLIIALVVALGFVVAGCPPSVVRTPSQGSIEKSYTVGATLSAGRGETMLSVRSMTNAPQYEVAFDYTPPQHDLFRGGLDYPPLVKGMRFVQVATRSDGAIGLARQGYGVTRSGSITDRETYMPVTIWVKDGVVSGSMEGKGWTEDMLFLPVAASSGVVEAAREELVFDGVEGALFEATWREFYSGPASPTASRPIRIDLSKGRTFVQGGITIEILEATGERVSYRVVDDGGMLWEAATSGS